MNSFHALSSRLSAEVGIAIASVGSSPVCLGTWSSGVAWSTSKVPLVIAASRAGVGSHELVAQTITQSDNAAAEELWSRLGDPASAAQQVQDVIREAGDPATVVESRRLREGYTAFGQTKWSLADQARFAAGLAQVAEASAVVDLMRGLATDHRWGLAAKGFAAKGGWGPGLAEDYLVRQFGIIPTASGSVGVAIAAEVHEGEYEAGVDVVNMLASWVVDEALSQQ
ncbi:MAG TPA: serine hydrolase [Mycobacterium sp.]|uniref:serine hydrolase n=1 Tax=Mycobacterium sp. TaxID=1785 RepID=UPI002CD951B0|nr:serine hydrolase [Mycobacterium sp.]HXO82861.1 serine hydrolase [Mycobacterium sp.]